MRTPTLDFLVWTAIYGGLLVLCLGLFVRRGDEALGWTFIVAGGVITAIGALLLWLRSHRPEP